MVTELFCAFVIFCLFFTCKRNWYQFFTCKRNWYQFFTHVRVIGTISSHPQKTQVTGVTKVVRAALTTDEYLPILYTSEIINEFFTCVRNWYQFFTSVRNWYQFFTPERKSHQFFTGVTNTYKFFTRQKLSTLKI